MVNNGRILQFKRGNSMKKIKRKHKIIGAFTIILIAFVIYFIQFTSLGYKITVPLRGYIKVKDNIYIDKDFKGDKSNVLSIIAEANDRLTKFWGNTKSKPTIIISNNEKKLKKLGWTGNPALTTTTVFFGAHSYVVIAPKGLNVDVTAHELTHAELHYRLYDGKIVHKTLIPTWFDEGIATQNDYRENYNYDAWLKATNQGKKIINFSELNTLSQFYNSNIDVRRYNYIVSKHEVENWIKTHSVEDMIFLINSINKGTAFHDLYYKE